MSGGQVTARLLIAWLLSALPGAFASYDPVCPEDERGEDVGPVGLIQDLVPTVRIGDYRDVGEARLLEPVN